MSACLELVDGRPALPPLLLRLLLKFLPLPTLLKWLRLLLPLVE